MDKVALDKCLAEMQLYGSERAFEQLYIESRKGVFSFIYSYLKNHHDAEDVMQLTYLKIRSSCKSYVVGTNAVAWILEIAKNLCLTELKKRQREIAFSEAENEISKLETHFKESAWFVLDAINKYLDDDERKIVMLHLVSDLKHREIAEIIKIPLGTVLWKYNKAIKTLKSKLGGEGDEE